MLLLVLLFVVASHMGFFAKANNAIRGVQQDSRKDERLLQSGDAHYPNLPTAILLPVSKVNIFPEAKDRKDIVNWTQNTPVARGARLISIETQDPPAGWLRTTAHSCADCYQPPHQHICPDRNGDATANGHGDSHTPGAARCFSIRRTESTGSPPYIYFRYLSVPEG